MAPSNTALAHHRFGCRHDRIFVHRKTKNTLCCFRGGKKTECYLTWLRSVLNFKLCIRFPNGVSEVLKGHVDKNRYFVIWKFGGIIISSPDFCRFSFLACRCWPFHQRLCQNTGSGVYQVACNWLFRPVHLSWSSVVLGVLFHATSVVLSWLSWYTVLSVLRCSKRAR